MKPLDQLTDLLEGHILIAAGLVNAARAENGSRYSEIVSADFVGYGRNL